MVAGVPVSRLQGYGLGLHISFTVFTALIDCFLPSLGHILIESVAYHGSYLYITNMIILMNDAPVATLNTDVVAALVHLVPLAHSIYNT